MSIIIGHKVILFPFSSDKDVEYLNNLDSDFAEGLSDDAMLYIVKTQTGKSSKIVGVMAINYIEDWKADILFLIDPQFYNGLDKLIAKKKESYVEDALATISEEMTKKGVRRIGYLLPPEEKAIPMILERIGYKREGVLRSYIKTSENVFSDIISYSLIVKEE